jgi:hypothetical protein
MNSRSLLPMAFTFAAITAGCGSDRIVTPGPAAARGIVVLDGYIQPGLTLLGDTGTASTRIALGAPSEFDAGAFDLQHDTVVAVSSRGAGDLLYIADLRTGTVRKVQLPSGGNAARARLIAGGNGSARLLVPLRDSMLVATVLVPVTGAPSITRIENAGRCPVDAFRFESATWVVDANTDCRTDYAVQGAVRLIRIPDAGTARDTIELSSLRGSAASAIVVNDVAYVSATGDADFGAFPYTLLSPGAVARVDLRARSVLQQKTMPAGSYGVGMKRGLDGHLYVSLYEDLDSFTARVLQLRADDLSYMNTSATSSWRTLTTPAGDSDVACGSATADALGRVHCLVLGAASATSLVVFSPAGAEVRRVAAGQGGVDLALRP